MLNVKKNVSKVLTDEELQWASQYFLVHSQSGRNVLLVRTDNKSLTYTHVLEGKYGYTNSLNVLHNCPPIYSTTALSLVEELTESFTQLQMAHHTFLGVKEKKFNGGTTYTYTPLFDCQNEVLKQLIKCPELCVPFIMNFTNEPDTPTLCFFDLEKIRNTQEIPTPHWDMFEAQIAPDPETAGAFKAWIFSIFKLQKTNRNKQMMYLVDQGHSGKSSILRAIENYLGSVPTGMLSQSSLKDRHGLVGIYGKRFIYFPENTEPAIILNPTVKALLGGDPVEIRGLFKEGFYWRPDSRLLLTSNVLPDVDLKAEFQKQRILMFKGTPMTQQQKYDFMLTNGCLTEKEIEMGVDCIEKHDYDTALTNEIESYLKKCEAYYTQKIGNGGNIILPVNMNEDIVSYCDDTPTELVKELFDDYFDLVSGEGKVVPSRVLDVIIQKIHADRGLNVIHYRNQIYRALKTVYNCHPLKSPKKVTGYLDKPVKCWAGLTLKSNIKLTEDGGFMYCDTPTENTPENTPEINVWEGGLE